LKDLALFLQSLNPRRKTDRRIAEVQLANLRSAMEAECRGRFSSVEMVLQSDIKMLPW
jgi:hypothetical protein